MAKTQPFIPTTVISEAVAKLDAIPLLSGGPTFSADNFASLLGQAFGIEGLTLEIGEAETLTSPSILKGLGTNIKPIIFHVSKMEGHAACLLSDANLSTVMEWTLLGQASSGAVPSENVKLAFRSFFACQIAFAFRKLNFPPNCGINLAEEEELASAPYVCVPFTLGFKGQKIDGRIALGDALVLDWRKKHGPSSKPAFDPAFAEKLPVELKVECGRSQFNLEQWQEIETGDIVVLEQCSINPAEKQGEVAFFLNGKKLFSGALNPSGEITLLDK